MFVQRKTALRMQFLGSSDGLVLQDSNHHATILGFRVSGLVTSANLAALAHCTGRQHVGQRYVALLQKEIRDVVGAVFTQLLVQCGASRR